MKSYILSILSLLITINSIIAQGDKSIQQKSDTLRQLNEIIFLDKKSNLKLLKIDVPLKYFPISSNSIEKTVLEKNQINDIKNASKFLPGVRVNNSYGGFLTLTVRGFSQSPIMIDGARDERTVINSFPLQDLSFVESIELLKGPASVLFGHSAIGGIINIVRKNPTNNQSIDAKISIGSYGYKRTLLGFGGKISKSMNYYAGINYSNSEGWRFTNDKKTSLYFALDWQIAKKTTLEARYGLNDDFYGTEIGLAPNMSNDVYNSTDNKLYLQSGQMQPNLDSRSRYNNPSDFFKHSGQSISINIRHKLNNNNIISNKTTYNHDDINYFGTEYLSYLESNNPIYKHYYLNNGAKKYICLDTVQRNSPLRFSHIANTVNNQLDFSGKYNLLGLEHNFNVGYGLTIMYRTSYTGYSLGKDVYGPGLYSKVSVLNPQADQGFMVSKFSKAVPTYDISHGIYFSQISKISEKLKFMISGRFDNYFYKKTSGPTINGERKYSSNETDPYSKVQTSAFTYRAGLVYEPIENFTLYTSIASSYKPYRNFYSSSTVYINSNGNRFYPEKDKEIFKPETGFQYEIGSRLNILKILNVSASVFYIKKENTTKTIGTLQEADENNQIIKKTIIGQVGVMDSKGFDLEVTAKIDKGLIIVAGYSYTDARNREIKRNPYMETDSGKDLRVTGVPENTFYSYTNYEISKGILNGLSVNYSLTFTDKVYRNISKNLYYPSFWISDLGIGYKIMRSISMQLNINNLFNKSYFDQSLDMQIAPAMPRNYMLSLKYSL